MMFGSFVHLVASKFPALQIAVLIILKFMHFIKKVGDGQVDLEQIEKEKHDAKKISEIWGAGFASAWTHTFIILPGDESRSPKQLQMDETVPNSEPMEQITAPFLDSCGDNAVDADDSKFMRFIKKVGDGQVVFPFLFVLNQHAQKIPEIWSADFASAWTYGLMFGYATDETEECMPLTVALAHRLNARLAALRKDGTFPWAGPDSKTQDGDGDMECPPRGSGPRNRPPYRSSPKDRRRPRRGRQSRPRADSGAPRGKRDDGDAPNKSDAADDYESKSDEPGNTHENNSDNVNVSPSSNQLSSGSGEPSDSAQTNEGYSNENSSEQANVIGQIDGADDTSDEEDEDDFQDNDDDNDDQNEDDIGAEDEERDDFLHKLTSVEDWLYGEGGRRTGSCLQRKLNELKKESVQDRPNTDVSHPDYVSKIFCCKRNQDSTILYQKRYKMFQKRVASDEDKTDAIAAAALILLSQVPDPVTGTSRESCREQKKDVLIKNMERKMGLSQTSVYYRVYFDGLKEAFNKDQLLISPPVIVLKIMLQAIFQPV